MTTIVVTHEDNEVDQFTFDASDRVISIGRRSTNDVCIPNLSVSGMHARITIDGDNTSIEDNSSTNGTYVNGRLISRQLINDTDEIMIGRSSLIVHLTPEAAVEQAPVQNLAADVSDADHAEPPVLNSASNSDIDFDEEYDNDDSFTGDELHGNNDHDDPIDDRPMSLSEKAKLALGREGSRDPSSPRPGLNGVAAAGVIAAGTTSATAAANRAFARDDDVAVAEAPTTQRPKVETAEPVEAHPLDGIDDHVSEAEIAPISDAGSGVTTHISKPAGAVIEIQNGAKSGQVLPIDKPVTTLGRPGIQIAAIMRKPDGYFLMHIESDDSVEMPTLNRDTIGDDPVMLKSGDRLNVAGIDVEFMLS